MSTLPGSFRNESANGETKQPVSESAASRQPPLPMEVNGEHCVTVQAVSTTLTCTQRDARGRFTKGHKFARGNPFHRRMAAMRRVFVNAVSPEEMQKLARRLYLAAVAGDRVAGTLFLTYALGRPEKVVDPDAVDIDEWRRLQDLAVSPGEMHEMLLHLPASTAASFAQHIWPEFVKRFKTTLAAGVRDESPAQLPST